MCSAYYPTRAGTAHRAYTLVVTKACFFKNFTSGFWTSSVLVGLWSQSTEPNDFSYRQEQRWSHRIPGILPAITEERARQTMFAPIFLFFFFCCFICCFLTYSYIRFVTWSIFMLFRISQGTCSPLKLFVRILVRSIFCLKRSKRFQSSTLRATYSNMKITRNFPMRKHESLAFFSKQKGKNRIGHD